MKSLILVAMIGLTLGQATVADTRKGPSGRVVDPDGVPILGARVCLMVAGAEELCHVTDLEGRYSLPASEGVSVRVSAKGFMPLSVAAVPQESPVVLDRAAGLLVRVLDAATGAGVPESKVTLVYSTGRQMGPLPANAAGLKLATLPPGEIRAVGRAEGYSDSAATPVTLVKGKTAEVVLKLVRTPEKPATESERPPASR